MLYLINPRKKRERTGGRAMARSKRKGTKRRRFSAKQLAAQRKFAAMARARAKAAKSSRARKKGATMAAKKKRRRGARQSGGGVMRSVVRAGGGKVSRRSWRSAGYRRNPKRGRRRYRRNPVSVGGIGRGIMDLGKTTVATLAGMAGGRMVTNLIPIGDPTSPAINFLKAAVVGALARTFLSRPLGPNLATAVGVGVMLNPTKDLAVSVFPQAAGFLGSYPSVMRLPAFTGTRALSAYPGAGGDDGDDDAAGMGSYATEFGGA